MFAGGKRTLAGGLDGGVEGRVHLEAHIPLPRREGREEQHRARLIVQRRHQHVVQALQWRCGFEEDLSKRQNRESVAMLLCA